MRLIIEALLILVALGQDHRAAAAYPLDMALNSVDDQYDGCIKEMVKLVEEEYLNNEIESNQPFGKAWKEGVMATKDALTPGDIKRHHLIAIHAYTNYEMEAFQMFNNAARGGKDNYKMKTYTWYSLHFLLTEAIQILRTQQNTCYDTYRGTNVEFDHQSKEIRLGSFSSSSLEQKVAQGFGTKSCFEIHTCYGADVTTFSMHPEQKEVLIPPYEKFEVTAVKRKTENKDLWCGTVYTLTSSEKTLSELNCALIEFKAKL